MIKHIVLFNVKEGEDKDQVTAIAAKVLEPLVGKIPGLLHMEIRATYQGDMDYALYSEFESRQALTDYRDHPAHLAAKEKFHHFLNTRIAADFEV